MLHYTAEADGQALENQLNEKGPGEAIFIYCDVTKEDDIKVHAFYHCNKKTNQFQQINL